MTLVAVLALVASACGRGGGDNATTTTKRETTTTADPRVPAPLSGRLIDPAEAARPVVMVKVDNSPNGRPQAGIDKADLLVEEMVEGSVTRFIAFFHSDDTDLVGPIRSIRTTDPNIVAPFGGVFVFSDGVPRVVNLIKSVPVTGVYEMLGAAPFKYPSGRQRPYKTFASTERLRQEAPSGAKAPPALVLFQAPGDEAVGASATPAEKVTVVFGSRTTAGLEWSENTGAWLRSTNGTSHLTADGTRLGFTSAIIQYVTYVSAGYRDAAGSVVEEAKVVGTGEGIALINGQQFPIKWSKASPTAVTTYTDSAGSPLRLPVGPVLIMLPRSGSQTSITAPTTSTTQP
ncbi:MAG: DUF3048 domain-containing protein [Acidimicrobiales bacterium]